MNQHDEYDLNELSIAALLRIAADDELDLLDEAQRAKLNAHLGEHPEDQRRIEFDRQLRSSCARVLSNDAAHAPAGLAERIQQSLGAEAAEKADAKTLGSRERSFWSGTARFIALAAALVIVATTAIYTLGPGSSMFASDQGYTVQVASFVTHEHQRCCTNEAYAARKFTMNQLNEVPGKFTDHLGVLPQIDGLTQANATLVGAGECQVPGKGSSIHLRLAQQQGDEVADVSLFIQRDTGQLELEAGKTYRLNYPQEPDIAIFVWKYDGAVYYLLSDQLKACAILRKALGAPEALGSL